MAPIASFQHKILLLTVLTMAALDITHAVPCPALPTPVNACNYAINPTCTVTATAYWARGGRRLTATTQAACCRACADTPGCAYWTWDNTGSVCYQSGACNTQVNNQARYRSGGMCNVNVAGDPHFMGAQGTHYDFNGLPDQSFCLIADKDLHVNMYLIGYYNANKVLQSWIRAIGVIWTNQGVKHTIEFAARAGKEAGHKRGPGLMGSIKVDDQEIAALAPGEKFSANALGLDIKMRGIEKTIVQGFEETDGEFDVDVYEVEIAGHMSFLLRLRAAVKQNWLPNDAIVHIDMSLRSGTFSEAVHGVLGQTYRKDHHQRAIKYQELLTHLHGALEADGESGKGFLDGTMSDYKESSVLSTGCKFASFTYSSADIEAKSIVTAAQ